MAGSDEIAVTLDRSVALVLFDFLARATDEEEGEFLADALQHKAELPALWATLAALESVLAEPFAPNYGALVEGGAGRGHQEARRGAAIAAEIRVFCGIPAHECALQRRDIESNIRPGSAPRSAAGTARSSRCRWQPTIP